MVGTWSSSTFIIALDRRGLADASARERIEARIFSGMEGAIHPVLQGKSALIKLLSPITNIVVPTFQASLVDLQLPQDRLVDRGLSFTGNRVKEEVLPLPAALLHRVREDQLP